MRVYASLAFCNSRQKPAQMGTVLMYALERERDATQQNKFQKLLNSLLQWLAVQANI